MDTILRDFSFALRSLRKQPSFTATVIATLALAIGAATSIFSVVESTLLRPLPFRTPERLVFLNGVAGPDRQVRGASLVEVQDWARLTRSFEHVAVYDETSLNLQGAEGAERVDAEMVSASFWPMIGARAQLGRVFGPEEDRIPDASPVVVISDAMWRERLSADPAVIGRTLTFNDRPFTVVGVMPPGFRGVSFDTQVWFPAVMARANGAPVDLAQRGNRWLGAVARLRDGVALETAQQDLDAAAARLARDFPRTNEGRGAQAQPLRDGYLGTTREVILSLFAAVGLFLLIAATNIVGLQLVRASGRRREIALRMAIGADRGSLVQQLVVEGLTLAMGGAIAGILVAAWGLEGLIALAPDGVLPAYAKPEINLAAFGFTLLIGVVFGVVFGLVPALRTSSLTLVDALKSGGKGSAAGFGGFGRGGRLGGQQMLVVAETALALLLLVGAGLFVRSLQRQLAVDPGFAPEGLLTARLLLPQRYSPAQRVQFAQALREKLAAIPSVTGVAVGSDMPLSGGTSAGFLKVPDVEEAVRHYRHAIGEGWLEAMGMRLVRGRAFGVADRDSAPPVVMINESMARRFWKDADPIGQRIRMGSAPDGPEMTIVGVVADARWRDLTTTLATTEPDIYFPLAQRPAGSLSIALRSTLPPEQLTASLRRELAELDPAVPLFGARPLAELLAQQTATSRFASSILSVFGAAALVLSAVGLYGVLAFLVSLRRREIGIRLAIGATEGQVLGGVVRQGVMMAGLGVAIGIAVALVVSRRIEAQLFGVGTRDPLVFGMVAAALLAVSALASLIPGRRAARVDPQIALRDE